MYIRAPIAIEAKNLLKLGRSAVLLFVNNTRKKKKLLIFAGKY